VWNGQWRNNSVAVKEFVFAQAAIVGGSLERNNIIEEIVGEAGVMACLRHPKILQLYGCSLTMQAIWIVSEFCSRGSLRMILNDNNLDLPLLKKVSICLDVADGMLYLHTRSPPIIHRDIKSHNIFITEPSLGHFVAKIGDWGSARAVALTGAKTMTQGVGTACWLAPEVINFAHASKDSDVYAFGIVLWEVFTRHEVYEGLSAAQIIAKVANEGLRPRVPRECPWAAIMTECWQQDASQRPGFHRVMTSLSKIYSTAKAVNKGKNMSSGSDSIGTRVKNLEKSALLSPKSKDSSPRSSIFRPEAKPADQHSLKPPSGVGGISGAIASFTAGKNQSGKSKSGGVVNGLYDIYFASRNTGADQYLTAKSRVPSRTSSDPMKLSKNSEKEVEEKKTKTWSKSNDVLAKALISWPNTSDKSSLSGGSSVINSATTSEKSMKLYDFSTTPTGLSTFTTTTEKKISSSSSSSRHSSKPASPSDILEPHTKKNQGRLILQGPQKQEVSAQQ
jgi:serine/threonine protein kinase